MTETSIKLNKPNPVLAWLARGFFKLVGWEIDYQLPDDPKMLVIFAPHTSNWDAAYMVAAGSVLGLKPNWLAKKELFAGPMKYLLSGLGAVEIDRDKNENKVDTIARVIEEADHIILGIAPEGTRSYTEYWRSGFYHIALKAGIPIHFAYIDYPNKRVGAVPGIMPTGDIDADMEKIRAFYQDKGGKIPENVGPVRFRPRTL